MHSMELVTEATFRMSAKGSRYMRIDDCRILRSVIAHKRVHGASDIIDIYARGVEFFPHNSHDALHFG